MSDPGPYAVLDAPGWDISKVDGNPTNGKIRYTKGEWWLRVNWRPAHSYDGYVSQPPPLKRVRGGHPLRQAL